ncbi:endonuclease [Loktanella sp. M215]|uniref:endonuclease n=1 Tax=Loktanella sp. M215 TaxID=2675431 RepID=UPI001F45667B|nr:endonuclease [Loktanella sp. M215]
MKDTAPKELGILLIAGVFGFIGGAVGFVMYDYGIAGSIFIMAIVGAIVAVALLLGWREPKVRPMGLGIGPVTPLPASEGGRDRPGTQTPHRAAAPAAMAPTSPSAERSGTASQKDGMATPTQPYDAPQGHETVVQTPSGAAVTHAGTATANPDVPTAATPDAADAKAPAPQANGGLKPSARLAGQEELASRKGSWTYTADRGASEADAQPDADTGAVAHPGAPGTSEAEAQQPSVADKPQVMTAPRDGGPDDLKQIKGVGPRLEETLHEMGIYHFDQIAAWSAPEVAWMDDNLKGFKGRVTRDDWIPQARTLASGGETEFSNRVDKGGVYDA